MVKVNLGEAKVKVGAKALTLRCDWAAMEAFEDEFNVSIEGAIEILATGHITKISRMIAVFAVNDDGNEVDAEDAFLMLRENPKGVASALQAVLEKVMDPGGNAKKAKPAARKPARKKPASKKTGGR